MSTGKGKATYLYMEQKSKDTNKILLGGKYEKLQHGFLQKKKIFHDLVLFQQQHLHQSHGNNKLKPFIICISIKNISITGNKKKNK